MNSFNKKLNGNINKAKAVLTLIMMLSGVLFSATVPIASYAAPAEMVQTVHQSSPSGGGGAGADGDSSGVAELDAAKDRTTQLVKWVCAWIGGLIALVSLIIALVMAASHQQEQRNQALVGLALGLMIAFAPQVVDFLLGK